VSGQPAWRKYEGWNRWQPDKAQPLADNRIERNIFVLDKVGSGVYATSNVPFESVIIKNNIVAAGGNRLKPGVRVPKTSQNAAQLFRSDFTRDALGKMPNGWDWFVPLMNSTAEIVRTAEGKALRIATPGTEKLADMRTPRFPVTAGKSYRLRVRLRAEAPNTEVVIYPQTPVSLNAKKIIIGEEWQTVTFDYTVSEKGDPKIQWIRLNLPQKKDVALWTDSLRVEEMADTDEWEAWRSYGLDSGTIVADPQFVEPGQGNYRLKTDSPALRLGFQLIPTDKIGRLSR